MSGRSFGGSAGGGKRGPGGGIRFTKNEPDFIRKLKAQVGYQPAEEDVEAKRVKNRKKLLIGTKF